MDEILKKLVMAPGIMVIVFAIYESIVIFHHNNGPAGSAVVDNSSNGCNATLSFNISMEKTEYIIGEPINVTGILKNTGQKEVKVCMIGIGFPSLDFNLSTPDGRIIHFPDLKVCCLPPAIELKPGEEYKYTWDITNSTYIFDQESGAVNKYNFTPGTYRIQAIYMSSPEICIDDTTVCECTLYSNTLTFIIRA